MEFAGGFETHITIAADDAATLDAARRFGSLHRLKFVHIVLDRGVHISQPMLAHLGELHTGYPRVEGDAAVWQMRLATAPAPTFDGMQPQEGSRAEKGA